MSDPVMVGNCPVLERTADGTSVGRCWFHLTDEYICPRHGNVFKEVEAYKSSGELQKDPRGNQCTTKHLDSDHRMRSGRR